MTTTSGPGTAQLATSMIVASRARTRWSRSAERRPWATRAPCSTSTSAASPPRSSASSSR
ncbi:hypothetical protein NKH77_05310 [Streptomyces sp. M19]